MVLQQVMQNPQMLQQIMQMATGPAGQGMLQMLMGQQGQDPRWAEKFQAGSGQESPYPLPGSVGGGTPYPTISPEQDDKAYLRELREDRLQPPRYPPPPGLTPEIMERIQRQTPREPNPRDFPEEYLQPWSPEPIAGLTPGLLTRLAMANPAQMQQDIPIDLMKTAMNLRGKRQPEDNIHAVIMQMLEANPQLGEDFNRKTPYRIPREDIEFAKGDYLPDTPMDEEEEEEERNKEDYKGRG